MIKYKLSCKKCDNSFDSWFLSSKEYEKLKDLKHINCPNCNSLKIEKGQLSINYNEIEVAEYMKNEKIELFIDMNIGKKSFSAYTMDLTKKYIEINSDYRS